MNGVVRVKNMKTGENHEVSLDGMCQFLYDHMLDDQLDDLTQALEKFDGGSGEEVFSELQKYL